MIGSDRGEGEGGRVKGESVRGNNRSKVEEEVKPSVEDIWDRQWRMDVLAESFESINQLAVPFNSFFLFLAF